MKLNTRNSLLLLLAVALVARILWWVFNISVIENEGAEYARLAENLVSGNGYVGMFGGPHIVFPPLFPALIGLFSFVSPDVEAAGRLVSMAAGLLLVAAVFGVSRAVFGERAAWIAALLAALHPVLIALSVSVYSEMLAMALVASGGYVAIRALQEGSPWRAAASGLIFGLAYLARPEALAFAAAAAGVIFVAWIVQQRQWLPAIRDSALVVLAAALVAAPYIAFLTSQAGTFRWESKSSLNSPVNARMAQGMSYPEAARGLNSDLTPAGPHLYKDQYIAFRQKVAGLGSLLETGLADPVGRTVAIARELATAAFLGSPWIYIAVLAGLVAGWWRYAPWPGLLWLSFCALQLMFLFLLQYTFARYLFPLLAVLIPVAAAGIASLSSLPLFQRRAAAASPAIAGLAVALIALASHDQTMQVGELLQSRDEVAAEAGRWMKAEHERSDAADRRAHVMGYGLVAPFYADAEFDYLPYAEEALALEYIRRLDPDFIIVRSSELHQAPYFKAWLERGIAHSCATAGFDKTSPDGERFRVWTWRCPEDTGSESSS